MATATKPQASTSSPARRQSSNVPAVLTSPIKMKRFMEAGRAQLLAVLPKSITPEKMIQIVATMMYKTPRLQECDEFSIFASIITGSSLGFDLTPSLNEGFLIPRWNSKTNSMECNFQPGYQGLRKLALNSGKINVLEPRVVRDGDEFRLEYNPGLFFFHRPVPFSTAPVVGYYSHAILATGEHSVEMMSIPQIEEFGHKRSEGYKLAASKGWQESGPWVTDYDEMSLKTVLKRHCKRLPRSLQLDEAIAIDNQEFEQDAKAERVTVTGSTASARLAARLAPPQPEDESQELSTAIEDQSQEQVSADDYGGADPGDGQALNG